jgi:hypothetical protein
MFFVTTVLSKGIVMPSESGYLIATLLILAFTVVVASPILKFLTIKSNFLTFFLMSALLLFGVFFLLKMFMVGFFVNEYIFDGLALGSIQIQAFTVSGILTMAIASALSALICAIYREVDSV